MPIQNYKSRKYVIDKVKSHKLLYTFLIKNRIYNKYIKACVESSTKPYNIDRPDFIKNPFMCFDQVRAKNINGMLYDIKYDEFIMQINEEI